jgi:hypothetical protein
VAISINPLTYVIYVPKADLTLIQASPEVRELNVNSFRMWLKDYEDDPDYGIYLYKTHNHNTEVQLAGLTYARIIEVLDPYTVEFENGSYTVNCVGANHNISDVKVPNSVSLIVNNAAGLISNAQIEYSSFGGAITVDPNSSYTGTTYPVGTPQMPVNNLDDALLLAGVRGFTKIVLKDDIDFDDTYNLDGFTIQGLSEDVIVQIDTIASVNDLRLENLTLQNSVLDGGVDIHDCIVRDVTYVNGTIQNSGLAGTITLGGNKKSVISDCYTVDQDDPPVIDMGGSGNDLAMPNYSGIVTFQNLTSASNELGVGLDAGMVTLDSTITAGTVIVSGIGLLSDNSTGTAYVNTDGILNADKVSQSTWESTNTFVCHDDSSIYSGTNWPVGTKKFPVNNLTDAIAIANAHGIKKIHIHNDLTITSGDDVSGFTLFADRSLGHSVTVQSGAITDETYFENLTVSGTMGGSVRYTTCVLGAITNFDGGAKNSLLTGNVTITGTGANYFTDCDTYVSDSSYKEISIGSNNLNIIRGRGSFGLTNYTGAGVVTIDCVAGQVKLYDTCTSGMIVVSGIVSLTDESGAGCTVIDGTVTEAGAANAVWSNAGGLRVLGLMQENYYMDQTSYDGSGNLTSARLRLYTQASSVGTDSDVMATYTVTATFTGSELDTYKVQKQ